MEKPTKRQFVWATVVAFLILCDRFLSVFKKTLKLTRQFSRLEPKPTSDTLSGNASTGAPYARGDVSARNPTKSAPTMFA